MFSVIQPYQWVAIRLPSDSTKIEQMIPNTSINLGKFGHFNTNHVINRPFHLTWEILDRSEAQEGRQLRLVKAAEIHADTLLEEAESDLTDGPAPNPEFDEYGLLNSEKSNVNIFDKSTNQKLTMEEIEALKADGMGSAKDLIAKIMASHSTIDQKTAFSLAKYTVRKQKKYMKRFTVLPLDVARMADWMMTERDFVKVMEIRNEMLALLGTWANVHAAPQTSPEQDSEPHCRYLVVDDTGGLVVAALAERMGILYHSIVPSQSTSTDEAGIDDAAIDPAEPIPNNSHRRQKVSHHHKLASSNTLTLVHSNQQPNLSLLRYFNYDPNLPPSPTDPHPQHPLHTHLKAVTWLQLLDPSADTTYVEPPAKTSEELHAMKSNARSNYYRKRRRWERCSAIVDEARAGEFNGLIVASHTNPISILCHLVPLLAGGAQIAVYSPHAEPLTALVDAYSTARRTAFLNLSESEREERLGSSDFPLDPTLTLGFMLQTARVRKWQVLPGRTHPLMTSRGGAEGYLATATRVIPVKGEVRARGKQGGRRSKASKEMKMDVGAVTIDRDEDVSTSSGEDQEVESNKRVKLEDMPEDNGATVSTAQGVVGTNIAMPKIE